MESSLGISVSSSFSAFDSSGSLGFPGLGLGGAALYLFPFGEVILNVDLLDGIVGGPALELLMARRALPEKWKALVHFQASKKYLMVVDMSPISR